MPKYKLDIDKTIEVLSEYDELHFQKYCLNSSCESCEQKLMCKFFEKIMLRLSLEKKLENLKNRY